MRKPFLLTLAAVLAGCSASTDAPSSASSSLGAEHYPVTLTAEQQEGQAIYETMCWTCHGTSGRGDGPAIEVGAPNAPPTFHTVEFANSTAESLERRFSASVEGADPSHPHMQHVAALLQPERFSQALAFVAALPYPEEIPGSAIAGKAIYEARCTGCHGPGGQGDGPAAADLATGIRPQDLTADTLLAARDWDAVFRRISDGGQTVHGSSMPPWSILLSAEEIWDVVAYLSTFQPELVRPAPWAN